MSEKAPLLTRVSGTGRRREHQMPDPAPAGLPATPLTQAQYEAWLDQLRADLAQSNLGTALQGARVVTVGSLVAGKTGGTRPAVNAGRLLGYGLYETTGANPATVLLRAGADDQGDIVVPITLQAGESVRDWFGPSGLSIGDAGLFVDIAAGSVLGAVYLGAGDE